MAKTSPKFKRVMLKLSGEALLGQREHGISPETCASIADEIKDVKALGIELAVVIGGGNIFRGLAGEKHGLDRTTGDYMGMLATVINALALQDALEQVDQPTRVQTAITMSQVAESYIPLRARRHMEKGRVVIFAAGTGNPFFTTDTTAVLRAAEIGAGAVLKATNVDGVYTADPKHDPNAKRFETLTHSQALAGGYKVMDATAFALCRDQKLPITVFSIFKEGAIAGAAARTPPPSPIAATIARHPRISPSIPLPGALEQVGRACSSARDWQRARMV